MCGAGRQRSAHPARCSLLRCRQAGRQVVCPPLATAHSPCPGQRPVPLLWCGPPRCPPPLCHGPACRGSDQSRAPCLLVLVPSGALRLTTEDEAGSAAPRRQIGRLGGRRRWFGCSTAQREAVAPWRQLQPACQPSQASQTQVLASPSSFKTETLAENRGRGPCDAASTQLQNPVARVERTPALDPPASSFSLFRQPKMLSTLRLATPKREWH